MEFDDQKNSPMIYPFKTLEDSPEVGVMLSKEEWEKEREELRLWMNDQWEILSPVVFMAELAMRTKALQRKFDLVARCLERQTRIENQDWIPRAKPEPHQNPFGARVEM